MEIGEKIPDCKQPPQALDPNCPVKEASSDRCVAFTFEPPAHSVPLSAHPTNHGHLSLLCVDF